MLEHCKFSAERSSGGSARDEVLQQGQVPWNQVLTIASIVESKCLKEVRDIYIKVFKL